MSDATKWNPSNEEHAVMDSVWMQIKGACEKLKEETKASNENVAHMLHEMADTYYRKN
ncbi:hypothetical protein [Prochlorococcus sp. MIT 1300]|uniref:hypothetical protein n=1 Tax=Prochlorococcus sp. MIT 1300 TaxID=3096218 RepID=UPI002A75D079|nr:hypothetical protein [Prochlorococcus sp. MIT 1300]